MIPKKKIKQHLKIEHRLNGKPYIKNYGYDISISHKDNFTVIGKIKKPFKIGVDIENLESKINQRLFLKYFLKNENLKYDKKRIITLWSIKEALFKCTGKSNPSIEKISLIGVKFLKNYVLSYVIGKK